MRTADLVTIATEFEDLAGDETVANPNIPGWWTRIAAAAEAMAEAATTANRNVLGYMKRTALALETMSGTSGAEENPNELGYKHRIVDALEELNGETYAGTLDERMVQGAVDLTLGPTERVTDGGFDDPGAWTEVAVLNNGGGLHVNNGAAEFASRTEYRLEQASSVPADASCVVSFDWADPASDTTYKVYLNGTVHTVIVGDGVTTSGHYSDTLVAGNSDSNIGPQMRNAFPGRVASLDNFSVVC